MLKWYMLSNLPLANYIIESECTVAKKNSCNGMQFVVVMFLRVKIGQ